VRVLVVGGGGREHALCWALARSPGVGRLWCAPGNAGTSTVAANVPISATDVGGLVEWAVREAVDLVVVGTEAPLVDGLADELRARGLAVFGPSAGGARIEGSKVFAARLCAAHGIPAASSRRFDDVDAAADHLASLDPPYVVKVDGLAGGKGVTVTPNRAEAMGAVRDALVGRAFGAAGGSVLVQGFLDGFEVSAMALVDGTAVVPLALAQDFKRIGDGDRGPNTGGMGAYSPVPAVTADVERAIREEILERTAAVLRAEGIDYRGVLYAGVMVTQDGPKVLEFNCRFGDPETQVVLPRLAGDPAELLLACAEGRLADVAASVRWRDEACVGVVLASGGYPGPVETGFEVDGLEETGRLDGVQVFHSGTLAPEDRVVTAGGRVLTMTALGSDLEEARNRAYEAAALIRFDGMTFRRDIAERVPQEAR
jgi:phosphoribosylamine--glycine ligase